MAKTVLVVVILWLVQCTEILAEICNGGQIYCGGDYECCKTQTKYCCIKERDNTYVIVVGCVLGGSLLIALVVGIIFYCIAKNKKRANVGPGTEMNFVGRIQVTGTAPPPTYGPMDNYQPPNYEDVQGPSIPPPAPLYDSGDVHKVKI